MNPIYYVIAESVPAMSAQFYLYRILKVWETTIEEVSSGKFDVEVRELRQRNFQVNTFFFQREPDNPFKDQA